MKISLSTIAFCIFPFLALACSCSGPTSFCATINSSNNENITIIGGKKISETDYTMDIEVIKVYRGEESRSRITVLGDTGASCLVYTSQFEIGEELILALHRDSEWDEVNGEDNKYLLSICGLYYVRCNNFINPFTGEIEDITACLGDDVCMCTKTKSIFYPNPSNGMLYSRIDQIDELLEDIIYVYNVSGQIVRKIRISDQLYANGILEINLSDLLAGVYIIKHSFRKGCGETKGTKIIIL